MSNDPTPYTALPDRVTHLGPLYRHRAHLGFRIAHASPGPGTTAPLVAEWDAQNAVLHAAERAWAAQWVWPVCDSPEAPPAPIPPEESSYVVVGVRE
jgi:hypothetical protein